MIAKFLYPGGNKYEPKGFIWTTVLGIVGALVATYLGQAVGWYKADENAGFMGAIVGAIILLAIWVLSHLVSRIAPDCLVALLVSRIRDRAEIFTGENH